MTLGELKTAVNSLGLDAELQDIYPDASGERVAVDARFCSIVTRSMEEINRLRPRVGYTTVAFRKPRVIYGFTELADATFVSIPLSGGKAYTFEVMGYGSYRIGNGEPVPFEALRFKRITGEIPEELQGASIAFSSDYMVSIRNVAVYAEKTGGEVPAYGTYAAYTIGEDDFIALDGESIRYEDLKRYRVRIRDNRTILVPWEECGEIEVRYNRQMEAVTVDTEDEEPLDLDDELAALLPALVASFVYLDDDAAKAQYFRQLYESDKVQIMRKIRNLDQNNIITTNNW